MDTILRYYVEENPELSARSSKRLRRSSDDDIESEISKIKTKTRTKTETETDHENKIDSENDVAPDVADEDVLWCLRSGYISATQLKESCIQNESKIVLSLAALSYAS